MHLKSQNNLQFKMKKYMLPYQLMTNDTPVLDRSLTRVYTYSTFFRAVASHAWITYTFSCVFIYVP